MKSRLLIALLCSSFIYCQIQEAIEQQNITDAIPEIKPASVSTPENSMLPASQAPESPESLPDDQPLGITEIPDNADKKVETPKKKPVAKKKAITTKKAAAKKSQEVAEEVVEQPAKPKTATKISRKQEKATEKNAAQLESPLREKKVKTENVAKKSRVASSPIYALLEKWEKAPREAAQKLIKKYGLPHEYSPSEVVWYNNGPWKYTVVSNELIPHNYPHAHYDSVEQVIDYPVSQKTFNELNNPDAARKLLEFNGSITFDSTRGELGAHCDSEETNFLLINIAHDVIHNKKTVEQAREFFTNRLIQNLKGVPSKLTSGFTFQVSKKNQGERDEISPLYKQLMSAGESPKIKVVKKGQKSKKVAAKKRVDAEPELEMTETVQETEIAEPAA